MIVTIFINNYINFLKLDLSLIYIVYIHVVFFIFILCRNLSKIRDVLNPINLANIDLLNEWICEEPNLFVGEIERLLKHIYLL
jgi:hypothetical protein